MVFGSNLYPRDYSLGVCVCLDGGSVRVQGWEFGGRQCSVGIALGVQPSPTLHSVLESGRGWTPSIPLLIGSWEGKM